MFLVIFHAVAHFAKTAQKRGGFYSLKGGLESPAKSTRVLPAAAEDFPTGAEDQNPPAKSVNPFVSEGWPALFATSRRILESWSLAYKPSSMP